MSDTDLANVLARRYNGPMLNIPLLVTVLVIVDSLHFVFARLLLPHISPGVSAMYVLLVGVVEVGIYGLLSKRLHLKTLQQYWWFFATIGFLVAGSTNINYEAVAFIDPGTATLLAQSGTIFALAFGLLWLRERLTPAQIVGSLIAIVGVFAIAYQPGDYLRLGSLLVLVSALMYVLHAAVTKRWGEELDFINFFFYRLLFTWSFLFLFSLTRGALALPTGVALPLLVLVGTTDIVISRTLYYVALRRLKMSVHTIVLTLSPVAAVLWSLALFAIVPTRQDLLGGAAILLGVAFVSLGRQSGKKETA